MEQLHVHICWMYHDIMDLYGDKGNLMVLQKRCEDRGIDVSITTCAIGQELDLTQFDLLFLGGGADREQVLLMDDLQKRRDNILQAMEQGTFVFLVCGGYQLFGQYYIAADGTKIEGLKYFDYYTEAGSDYQRCIGNIAITCHLDGHDITAVGFENHGGQTRGVTKPLGDVLFGCGNNVDDHQEGFYNGQVFATYMHGPLLPKNPEIADFMIYKSLKKNHPDFTLEQLVPLDDTFEQAAKQRILDRYKK